MECCLQTLGVFNRNKRRYREKDFRESLSNIKDRILTATAKNIAVERHQFMIDFFDRINAECKGNL